MFTELMLQFLNRSQNSTSCKYYQLPEGEFEMARVTVFPQTQVSLRKFPSLVFVASCLSFVTIHSAWNICFWISVFFSLGIEVCHFSESRCAPGLAHS